MMVHTYNPSSQEVEAGGWEVGGQPELHSKTLCLKKKEEGLEVRLTHVVREPALQAQNPEFKP
jgi:hypothetical protein